MQAAVERIGAFGLDDADLRHALDEAEVLHLRESLAQRGAVGEVSAGNDDVVRNLPFHLLQHLEGRCLLTLKAIGIDRVQQVDWRSGDDLRQHAHATVKVGAQLHRGCAVVHGLRELSPRNLAFRNQHQAAQSGARGVSGHRCGGVACGGASDPLEAAVHGDRERSGHSGVLERAGRIHALVLGEQPVHAQRSGGFGHLVERCVALAQRHDTFVRHDGKQVTEAPDAALVDGERRGAAFLPEIAQSAGIGPVLGRWAARRVGMFGLSWRAFAPRVLYFKQVSAGAAAKVALCVCCGNPFAATCASEYVCRQTHLVL